MTALAGIWRFGGGPDQSGTCRGMLEAQKRYARRAPAIKAIEGAALGCSLYDLLPEDRFDAQPYVHASGRWMLAADARVDNRGELLDLLGLRAAAEISDAELLYRGYERWSDDLFTRAIGDFAIVVWDAERQTLTLARDPAGQRPLHYRLGSGFAALASMPEGIHAVPEVERALDPRQLALFVSDVPRLGSDSFFRGIARVEPGHIVKITRSGAASRPFWEMPAGELRYPGQSDYVEAFREQLDRATKVRMRGSRGAVAAHLSAGLDSSAVAATAARLQPEASVTAITSAPRIGFSGPVPSGRLADESGLAAETAAMYPNMDHLVLRSPSLSPLGPLAAGASAYQEPVGHPCNHSWWSAANEAVSARGIPILLTGETGNLTISSGGISVLSDYIRAGQWRSWWREARASAGTNGWHWRGVLAMSFGPWMPRRAWIALNRLTAGQSGVPQGVSLVQPRWQAELANLAERNTRTRQLEKDQRRLRWRLMMTSDPGSFRKGALARWGVDERDPTADRLLAEFCLSLPPEQLLARGVSRRLARLALADRLPPSVLQTPRGYQYADWYEAVDRASVEREIRELEARLGDSSVLDFGRIKELAASWPEGGWDSLAVIGTYRILLLRALSAGAFEAAVRQ